MHYICPENTRSLAPGASVCLDAGGYESMRRMLSASKAPTSQPTGQPTSQPSWRPTAMPTTASSAIEIRAIDFFPKSTPVEDLKNTKTVTIFFGSVWIITLGTIFLSALYLNRPSRVSKAKGQEMSDPKANLNGYIDTFFPEIYSNQPRVDRFTEQLLYQHKYFQMYARKEWYRKFVGALERLSICGIKVMLIMVSFSFEDPVDDGSCRRWKSSSDCEKEKFLLQPTVSICSWVVVNGQNSTFTNSTMATSVIHKCVWDPPPFEPARFVVISLFLDLLTGPLLSILSDIIKYSLFAATLSEFKEDDIQFKLMFHQNKKQRKDQASSWTNWTKTTKIPGLFELSTKLSSKLQKAYIRAYRSAEALKIISSDEFLIDYRFMLHEDDYSKMSNLLQSIDSHERMLVGRQKERFRSQWPMSTGEANSLGKTQIMARHALAQELRSVVDEATHYIEHLKKEPPFVIGIAILRLFVLDMIGRNSIQAKMFEKNLTAIEQSLVITWGLKCLMISVILVFDILTIYLCIYTARIHPASWQNVWVLSSVSFMVMDSFIKQINVTVIVSFIIPNFIFDQANLIKLSMCKSVGSLLAKANGDASEAVNNMGDETTSNFSATDYLFVSTRVARAFPSLFESRVVLAYRSPTVSHEQSSKWSNKEKVILSDSIFEDVKKYSFDKAKELLLILGGYSKVTQKMIISGSNPLVLGAITELGTIIFNGDSNIGVPVGLSAFMVGFLAFLWFTRGYDHFSKTNEVAPLSTAANEPFSLPPGVDLANISLAGARRRPGAIPNAAVAPAPKERSVAVHPDPDPLETPKPPEALSNKSSVASSSKASDEEEEVRGATGVDNEASNQKTGVNHAKCEVVEFNISSFNLNVNPAPESTQQRDSIKLDPSAIARVSNFNNYDSTASAHSTLSGREGNEGNGHDQQHGARNETTFSSEDEKGASDVGDGNGYDSLDDVDDIEDLTYEDVLRMMVKWDNDGDENTVFSANSWKMFEFDQMDFDVEAAPSPNTRRRITWTAANQRKPSGWSLNTESQRNDGNSRFWTGLSAQSDVKSLVSPRDQGLHFDFSSDSDSSDFSV